MIFGSLWPGVATVLSSSFGCPMMALLLPLIVSNPWSGLLAVGCVLMSPSTTRCRLISHRWSRMYGASSGAHQSSLLAFFDQIAVGFLYRYGMTTSCAFLCLQ